MDFPMQKGLILPCNRAEHPVPLTMAVDNCNTTNTDLQNYNGANVSCVWGASSEMGLPVVLFVVSAQHSYHFSGRTRWKLHVKWDSHCIMSKKIGMVALRSSISGTSVISSMGPTISGMNLILWAPEEETKTQHPRKCCHVESEYPQQAWKN